MANAITISRLLLLLVVVLLVYFGSATAQLFNVVLLILMFASDGLDGYVARKFNQCTLFGATFDIAADRIVELCLWVVFAHIGMLPVWIPLVYITRGILTDAIRATETQTHAQEPFASVQGPLAKVLVSGRFMRGFYATLKAVAFCLLMLALALAGFSDTSLQTYVVLAYQSGLLLSYLAVAICLVRGSPVIIEFIQREFKSS